MFKKHSIFSHILYMSNTLFSSCLYEAQSALIGQLDQCVVIGQAIRACLGNVTPLTITISTQY